MPVMRTSPSTPSIPKKARPFLEEAGYVLNEDTGCYDNADGEELTLKFTTTTAAFRQTWAAVFEKQMADCGIRILRFHVPASWWFGDTTGLCPPRLRAGRLRLGRSRLIPVARPCGLATRSPALQRLGRPELHGLVQ